MRLTVAKFITIAALLLAVMLPARGQVTVQTVAGISNMEHLSTGIGINFSNRHNIVLLFGSNAFIKTNRFASCMLHYDVRVNRMKFYRITPRLGLKGGYSVYTNDYYRWRLAQVIPFVGFSYPLTNRIALFTDMGLAISRVLSMERVAFGEIGSYRQYLPELKVGLSYRF